MIGLCHIPKTGGTSLVTGMRDSGLSVFVPPHGETDPWELDYENMQVPDGTDVVAGHIPASQWHHFPVDEWVTILRQPVIRWVSHLYWQNRNRVVPKWTVPPSDMMSSMLGPDPLDRLGGMRWWHYTDLTEAAAWFGVKLPQEPHKQTTRPNPIPADLWATTVAANRLDVELWGELHR